MKTTLYTNRYALKSFFTAFFIKNVYEIIKLNLIIQSITTLFSVNKVKGQTLIVRSKNAFY